MKTKGFLPREVIKWIHSLDLTYSVVCLKRDFSNGFLIAEILSKYFPDVVRLEAFDAVSSKDSKLHNWNYIVSLFGKVGFSAEILSPKQIQDIVEINEESAESIVKLLLELYQMLSPVIETRDTEANEGKKDS